MSWVLDGVLVVELGLARVGSYFDVVLVFGLLVCANAAALAKSAVSARRCVSVMNLKPPGKS
jgi:hypothetical protein